MYKFTKKSKGDTTTIRKVWNEEKTIGYGLVGMVGDLLDKNILTYCDYSRETWVFIGFNGVAFFGNSRENVINGGIKA